MSAYDVIADFRIDVNGNLRSAPSLGEAVDIAVFERKPVPTNTAIVRIGDCVIAKVRGPHLIDFSTPADILADARAYEARARATYWGESTSQIYSQLATMLHTIYDHWVTRVQIVAQ